MLKPKFTQLLLVAFASVAIAVKAQIPTTGLVAYYPFNGNAKDMSGNGNDGTVNGATLTTDRFGNANSAYSFNGTSNYIEVPRSSSLEPSSEFTISAWANLTDLTTRSHVISKRINPTSAPYNSYSLEVTSNNQYWESSSNSTIMAGTSTPQKGKWTHLVLVYDGSYLTLYVNGSKESTTPMSGSVTYNTSNNLLIGSANKIAGQYMYGKIDDVRIYDNALGLADILRLYKEGADKVTITKEPVTKKVLAGDTTSFDLVSTGTMLTYEWQTEVNGTFQDLTPACPYNLVSPNFLKINPVSKDFFNTNYRVIVYNGVNRDTSATVTLLMDTPKIVRIDTIRVQDTIKVFDTTNVTIYDTSHVSVYDTTHIDVFDTTYVVVNDTMHITVHDTMFVKVTDTLVIDAVLGVRPPAQVNRLRIFPNPAKDHLYIDNGDYSKMENYSIEIRNALGQVVFHEFIDQQQFSIDLSGWTGKGLYILKLNDKSNKTIEVRKIVLQ